MSDEDQKSPSMELLESAAEAIESNRALIAAVAGYREICIENGFSREAAEVMATEYHSMMMKLALQ